MDSNSSSIVVALEAVRSTVLVGVVLVGTLSLNVVLIIHVLCTLFGMSSGLDRVVLVHSLGLDELVDLSTDEASEEFLGELVGNGFAWEASVLNSNVMESRRWWTYPPCVDDPRRA